MNLTEMGIAGYSTGAPRIYHPNVMVFGAGGRIGLPLSVWLANSIAKGVIGIELDGSYCTRLNRADIPFEEKGLEEGLVRNVLMRDRLKFITKLDEDFDTYLEQTHLIVIVVGTPPDGNGLNNAALDAVVNDLVKSGVSLKGKHIAIRSTVRPGTTDKIAGDLYERLGYKVNVFYWPERVLEGNALEEFSKLVNIFGLTEGAIIPEFLNGFSHVLMTAKEAEFTKVATNMVRYMEFAMANELMMRASEFGVDFNKIFKDMKYEYPRIASLKAPGINVGGPCLHKDGKALSFPGLSGMIEVAHEINSDSVLNWTVDRVLKNKPKSVLFLGAAFKPDSDDERLSMQAELSKRLWIADKDLRIHVYDPHIEWASNKQVFDKIEEFDAIIVVTPHSAFNKGIYDLIFRRGNPDAWIHNYWKAYGNLKDFPAEFQIKQAINWTDYGTYY